MSGVSGVDSQQALKSHLFGVRRPRVLLPSAGCTYCQAGHGGVTTVAAVCTESHPPSWEFPIPANLK